jgi:hypothetical protein
MTDLYRIRVRRGDVEVEVESTNEDYVSAKLNFYLSDSNAKPQTSRLGSSQPGAESQRPLSMGEFIRQISPEKKNEIAATLAYFLEFHAEPVREEWKPDEVATKFTDVRKPRPANITDLLKKSEFFMVGKEKGSYRLSGTGVKWVEDQMANAL